MCNAFTAQPGIIDLHCDSLSYCMMNPAYHLRRNNGHVSLEKLAAGGCGAQCFAIFIPTHEAAAECNTHLEPYDYYRQAVQTYHQELAANHDLIRSARTAEELIRNQEEGLLSSILTVEDAVLLDGHLNRLDTLQQDGVRMISLTWNYENSLGYPNSTDPRIMQLGLKPFGRDCIRRMNELGMVIDVSHLSEGGFWDVAKLSQKPFAASHSCATALCQHSRNLTDQQLRAIADHGGVVGINFCADFLRPGSHSTQADDIAAHMLHIRRVAGVDVLAFGSDFDGFDSQLTFQDCAGLPQLLQTLETHFSPSELEKICRGNVLRMLKDVIGS